MKRMYLVRHAKSSWKNPLLDDINRPLNKRGKKDAPFMGKVLKKQHILPDLIVTSPAKRAMVTARKIAKEIGYDRDKILPVQKIYEASVSDLMQIIRNLDDHLKKVMLVGHNPTLTELTGYLTSNPVNNIPTCGIFCLDFPFDSWKKVSERTGIFIFFDYPKKYAK